ncbi:uncharacterized protein METZ01_LOCUS377290, partial [marine metagenome]
GAFSRCGRGGCPSYGLVARLCSLYLRSLGVGLSLFALVVDPGLDKSVAKAWCLDGIFQASYGLSHLRHSRVAGMEPFFSAWEL